MALSRCYHPDDYEDMTEALAIVDEHFTKSAPQSEHRRWEYATALVAIEHWSAATQTNPTHLVDVGGNGSPFHHMVAQYMPKVVDPKESDRLDLAGYLHRCPGLAPVVTCLSVIEHVEDLDRFLYHLSCLVAPGGLLILTTDIVSNETFADWKGQDKAHFHWLRKRIFSPEWLYDLSEYVWAENTPAGWFPVAARLSKYGFGFFAGCDSDYHGDQLYGGVSDGHSTGYSLASLVMSKRP